MIRDLIWAWRQLARRPRLTAGVVLILALACSAATALFGVVDRLWLHPLALPDPSALMLVSEHHPALPEGGRVASLGLFYELESALRQPAGSPRSDTAEATTPDRELGMETSELGGGARLAASRPWRPVWLDGADGSGTPHSIDGARITPGFLRTLGIEPAFGRGFDADDARPGAELVVLVGHGFWQRELGSDPRVLERRLRLDIGTQQAVSAAIVGVLPPRPILDEPLVWGRPAIWAPIPRDPVRAAFDRRFYRLIARLPVNASGALVSGPTEDLLEARFDRLRSSDPAAFRDWHLRIEPIEEHITEPYRPALSALLWIMALVFGAACANVAILLSARAADRARELDLRLALGARRGHIARQLLAEGTVLAGLAGLVGWIASHAVLAVIGQLASDERRLDSAATALASGFAPRSLLFAAGLSVLTAILFSLMPILRTWRHPDSLAARTRALGERDRWRRPLLRLELAVAMVLVACSMLVGTSLRLLLDVDPGFRTEGIRTLDLRLPRSLTAPVPADPAPQSARHPFSRLVPLADTLEALPEIDAAAFVHPLPMSGQAMGVEARAEVDGEPIRVGLRGITDGLPQALGIPLLEGRDFDSTETDPRAPPPVVEKATDPAAEAESTVLPPVLVSQSLARRLWPTTSALDRELVLGWRPGRFRVVGVLGDIHHSDLGTPPEPAVYLPLRHFPTAAATLVIRTDSELRSSDLRQRVHRDAPWAVIETMSTIRARVVASSGKERLIASIFATLALLGLALAISGTWAVVALGIAQRRREIGVRLALGAPPPRLISDLVREVAIDAAIGTGLGLLGVILGSRLLERLLFGVSATDPFLLGASAVLLIAATAAIAHAVARRLRHFLPAEVLHQD